MIIQESLKHFVIVCVAIFCTHLSYDLLSGASSAKGVERVVQVSFLKASSGDGMSDTDSLASFQTVSMGSSDKYSVSSYDSDKMDTQSISSADSTSSIKKPKIPLIGAIRKSLSSPHIFPGCKGKGIKSRFTALFKKRKSKAESAREGVVESAEPQSSQPEPAEQQAERVPDEERPQQQQQEEDENEDDEDKEPENPTPPNPRLDQIFADGASGYDAGIMQLYLETQVSTTDSQILKSKEILANTKELYKSVRKGYSGQSKSEMCPETMIETIFVALNQLFMASSYCEMASIKIMNEVGFCRNRCKILNSKSCKTCRSAFNRKDKCKAITNKAKTMADILEKILKGCAVKNTVRGTHLEGLKLYKSLTPFKCSEEQYMKLRGKFEAKLYSISLKVSYVNSIIKLKNSCSSCVREECMSCKSMSQCPQCPGIEDIFACSNCLAAQNLQGTHILARNKQVQEARRIYSKLLSCESYLAILKGDFTEAEVPTESEVGKLLEQKIQYILTRYLSFTLHGQGQEREQITEGTRGKQYRLLPQEIKEAILRGAPLKTPDHQRPEEETLPTQLSEAYKKMQKKKEKGLYRDGVYEIPQRTEVESTDEERSLAVLLFERGICTYLMIQLLEGELGRCNSEIEEKSNQHSGCEHCIMDGCRKKRCSNIPELKTLILKRESITAAIAKCNSLGFVSQSELKAKIEELKSSGVISPVASSSGVVPAPEESADLGHDKEEKGTDESSDDDLYETTRL
ncbi:signal peptide containing protein [Cryptosporidium canis]|uniref:Signal peptide containing protein n=1 Tax=Cryptosporidium canis TaxID=195482 RepID=A0ABQ8P4Y5_9CRYT|nr:signal peptide containing protein [Cryptosporidium canis]